MTRLNTTILLLMLLAISACTSNQAIKLDTSVSGAYQFEDGTLFSLTPSNETRIRMLSYDNGEPYSLYYNQEDGFNIAKGFGSTDFFATGNFQYNDKQEIIAAKWTQDGVPVVLTKLPLVRKTVMFKSGDLMLRGELTLPEGKGPFPVVVTVHGSESSSAVDYYHWPYLLAANGIAGFKYDKRGTGGSEGEYTQHFPTLAGDTVAAINYLRSEPSIDMEKVNLLGFSQGGWIAPLVAKEVDIQSYIIAFGTSVPTPREDRWGYVKRLLDNGYGEKEIGYADEINALITQIVVYHNEAAWDELLVLKDKYQDAEWFKVIANFDSMLGFVSSKLTHPLAGLMPDIGWKWYTQWKRGDNKGPGFNRTYQPLETLSSLHTPSLWLLAGEDTSLPTPETARDLASLKSQGLPIDFTVYPGAEHGNVLYTTDAEGKRTYTHYVDSYFKDVVNYFQQQNNVATNR